MDYFDNINMFNYFSYSKIINFVKLISLDY
jgi:hypothetical protein